MSYEESARFRGMKTNAYFDYVSTRMLFINNGFLVQACILSAQTIEKLLKSIIFLHGYPVNKSHDVFALYQYLKHKMLALESQEHLPDLNPEYLRVLSNIYQSRYIGDCPPGFNYLLLKNKFLAEFDYTFDALYKHSGMLYVNEGKADGDDAIKVEPNKNGQFSGYNYLYLKQTKDEFLNQLETVTEFRIFPNYRHVLAVYTIARSFDDGKFLYDGLIGEKLVQFTPIDEVKFLVR